MRPWMITAKRELAQIKRVREIIPLAEPIQDSARIAVACRLGMRLVIEDGQTIQSVLITGRVSSEIHESDLLLMFAALKCGGHILATCDEHIELNVCQLTNTNQRVVMPPNATTEALVRAWNLAINRYRTDISASASASRRTLRKLGAGRSLESAQDDMQLSIDFATAITLFKYLPNIFTTEQLCLLQELFSIEGLPERAKRYKEISGILERDLQRQPERRMATEKRAELIRERCLLACPEAHAQQVAQYMEPVEPLVGRNPFYVPLFDLSDQGWVEYTDPVPQPQPRTPEQDLDYVREHFPLLYKIAMRRTPEEQESRRITNMLRRLRRAGVPQEFVRSCLETGLRTESQIIGKFTCGSGKADSEATPTTVRSKTFYRRVNEEQAEEEAAAAAGFRTKEEFLDSISFSPMAVRHITEHWLTVHDIVYGICKGFDFGRNSGAGAVGNSHSCGPKIRRAIARNCVASPDQIIGYLGDVGLLNRFGSTSKGRKKDDAMSINVNPTNPIGREIIDRLQRGFRVMRSAGTSGNGGNRTGNGKNGH